MKGGRMPIRANYSYNVLNCPQCESSDMFTPNKNQMSGTHICRDCGSVTEYSFLQGDDIDYLCIEWNGINRDLLIVGEWNYIACPIRSKVSYYQ